MRVLLTGCNGQVGYCLAKKLSDRTDVTLLALDRKELDITNSNAVKTTVEEFQPNIVINAAAYTAVDKAEEELELAYAINRDGPKFLAEASKEVGAAILHISTDYVFKGNRKGEYKETDMTGPQGVYGASKLAGEIEVAKACGKHIILRTAWVFGEHGNNFVKTMLRLGMTKNALNIVGDQFGGPTYAGDIADALIQIATKITVGDDIEYGIYHYSGLPHVSWYEFAEAIFDVAVDKNLIIPKPTISSIGTHQYPTPAKRPSNSRLSIEKISNEFSIEASDWQAALNEIQKYSEK
ncbi:TPA: dTDP-4-dehydrorhamnose reductase [Vibrio fluvialis]|nr:dTDP-4-dehydrorhamnose reductase [Vibrio fluvialis]